MKYIRLGERGCDYSWTMAIGNGKEVKDLCNTLKESGFALRYEVVGVTLPDFKDYETYVVTYDEDDFGIVPNSNALKILADNDTEILGVN